MRNINRGIRVFFSLVAVLCLTISGHGQSRNEMDVIFVQDKYYSGLNAYIFNASMREGTAAELKSVFRDDGAQSIVYKDLNLIDEKSISTQTDLNEYLTALGLYANRCLNERTIFKIESELVRNSYTESSKYISYLGKNVLVSTIDVNKTIIYGRKHIQVKDHITLYDGLIEKIESVSLSQEPPKPSTDDAYKKKGYMDIVEIIFGNTDYDYNVLTEYGATLYEKDIRYLTPKIKYNGLVSEAKVVDVKAKIFRPDGTLSSSSSSPSGFTYSYAMNVLPGKNNSCTISGWGNKQESTYQAGTYRYELWYGDNKLYSTSFVIKAKSSVIEVVEISFGNVEYNGDVINAYGTSLNDYDMRFISPKIKYNGLNSVSETIELKTKIFTPDGTLWRGDSSPTGYSQSMSITVSPGNNHSYTLSGYGKSQKSIFTSGTYRYELWYGDNILYSTSFVIKAKNILSKGEWRTHMKKAIDNATDKLTNGAYKGQKGNGQRSGLGLYWWENGSFYWGGWSNGDKDGYAITIVPNDNTVNNCSDCVYHVGYWKNGVKSGKGTCYDKHGNLIYSGNFSNDKPTGTYPMTGYASYKFECVDYTNGDKYIGETYMGKRHGYGIYLWKNGDAWYGPWEDGARKGYGINLFYNGSMTYGYWSGDTYSSY